MINPTTDAITEFAVPTANSAPGRDHGRARRQPLVHRVHGDQIGELQLNATVATTTTALAVAPNPGTAGQPITFTVTVTDTSGATTPTGPVDLMNGATTIGMGTLSGGQATITAHLPQGSYSVTAVYAGNSSFQTSTSPAVAVTVADTTSTSVTASPNPGIAGQPITFTATVTNTSGATTPTGIVDLMNGATTIGMGTLGSNGQATIMVTLPQGSYSITAVYAGNSSFQGSRSQASFTVNTPSPAPSPTPTPPPTFLGEQRMTVTMKVKKKKTKVVEYVLTFNGALASPNGLYQVTQPGRTKKSAPKHVAVTSMTLGTGGTSVILALGSFTAGKPLTLNASGLTGGNGKAVASFVTGL